MILLSLTIGLSTSQFYIDAFTYDPPRGIFAYYIDDPRNPVVCRDVDYFSFSGPGGVRIFSAGCASDTVFRDGFER